MDYLKMAITWSFFGPERSKTTQNFPDTKRNPENIESDHKNAWLRS